MYRGDNITYSILIKLFESLQELDKFLTLNYQSEGHSFVSRQTPLLSNLSIRENISLILQVHEKLSRKDALQQAQEALERLNLGYLCELRYNKCNSKEVFRVQLIRASMIKDSQIIIDQPFSLVREEVNLDFVFKTLDHLHIENNKVMILDLNHQKNYYKESPCLIIK